MGVVARWHAAGRSGSHRAFCCFGDAQRLGLVRVRIDDTDVIAEQWGPVPLPGFDGCTDPIALRLLSWVLNSPPEDLTELMSECAYRPDEIVGCDTEEDGGGGEEVRWQLGQWLGNGYFGFVVADTSDPECVLKVTHDSYSYSGFDFRREQTTLETLADLAVDAQQGGRATSGGGVPSVRAALLNKKWSSTAPPDPSRCQVQPVIALKLAPRAVSLYDVLRSKRLDNDLSALGRLTRALGLSVLDTLRAAHGRDIAHCDVRAPNIMLLPRPDDMAAIVAAAKDLQLEPSALQSMRLDECGFLLNDWGNAAYLDDATRCAERGDYVSRDLFGLVCVLMRLAWRAHGIPQDMQHEVAPPISLPPRLLRDMIAAARASHYDALRDLIGTIQYLEKSYDTDTLDFIRSLSGTDTPIAVGIDGTLNA